MTSLIAIRCNLIILVFLPRDVYTSEQISINTCMAIELSEYFVSFSKPSLYFIGRNSKRVSAIFVTVSWLFYDKHASLNSEYPFGLEYFFLPSVCFFTVLF